VVRLAMVALVSFGFGVVLMDTLQERKQKPEVRTYAEPLKLTAPLQCDATVNGKCYVRGMRK